MTDVTAAGATLLDLDQCKGGPVYGACASDATVPCPGNGNRSMPMLSHPCPTPCPLSAMTQGLRVPLQALDALQRQLADGMDAERLHDLAARFHDTLHTLATALDALVETMPAQPVALPEAAPGALPGHTPRQVLAGLTRRQFEIMTMVLQGQANKTIAATLGISRRTVENHRAAMMRKTGMASLPALVRLAQSASMDAARV